MKILLILPNRQVAESPSLWMRKKHRMGYAPTTLTKLAALVPKHLNADISIIDEGIEELLVDKIEADLVGISVLSTNAFHAYRIADQLRKRGITIVLGGVHVSFMLEEALIHADAVVVGFAEKAWPQLLNDYQQATLKRIYQVPVSQSDLNGFYPNRTLLKRKRYILPDTLESTRGCLNRCQFCIIHEICKGQFLKRDIIDVITEIKQFKGKNIVFLDSSPTEDPPYFRDLCKALKPLKIRWYCCITSNFFIDDSLLKDAANSGLKGVLIGFESLNQISLQAEGKYFNQVSEYKNYIKKLHRLGIYVLGSFMFGFDDDDPTIFERTIKFVDESNIDLIHYAIYTPLPGSADFERLSGEGRILTTDWSKYDCTKVVFKPKGMSLEELQRGFLYAYEKTHSSRSILKRILSSGILPINGFIGNVGFRLIGKIIKKEALKYLEEYKINQNV